MKFIINEIPNNLKSLAVKLYPYRLKMYLAIPVSWIIAFFSINNLNNTKPGAIYFISLVGMSFSAISFSWLLVLSLICMNFYPNQSYPKNSAPLNTFEMSSKFGRAYTMLFISFGVLFSLAMSFVALSFLFAPIYHIITRN